MVSIPHRHLSDPEATSIILKDKPDFLSVALSKLGTVMARNLKENRWRPSGRSAELAKAGAGKHEASVASDVRRPTPQRRPWILFQSLPPHYAEIQDEYECADSRRRRQYSSSKNPRTRSPMSGTVPKYSHSLRPGLNSRF